MRVFVAGIATEVNTYSPVFIGIDGFRTALLARPGEHDERPTLVTAPLIHARTRAAAGEFELVEGTTAWADPGGLINRQTYEDLRDDILDQLSAAMPVDAVALCLHGAMVAQGYDDPEGDLIERIRARIASEIIYCKAGSPYPSDPRTNSYRKARTNIWPIVDDPFEDQVP